MNADNVNQQLRNYLKSMQTLPAPNSDLMAVITLPGLREMARSRTGKKVTQTGLAKALGRGRSTISQWELGMNLNGVNTSDLLGMANAFGCRVEEVVAAIENTRLLTTKEEN